MKASTVCPLDCPDSCSLDVIVEDGRVASIDGSHANPVTDGYICAKVRRFPERVYGPDRLTYPAVRKGPKGTALFQRISWDEALAKVAERLLDVRRECGGEAILPYSYGGSNGMLTQDTSDATLFRRLGASRLARTICAAPTGAANLAMYGKMPSVDYHDVAEARLVILWGANPSTSGIHLVPHLREAQRLGATLIVLDPPHRSQSRRTFTWRYGRAPTSPLRCRFIGTSSRRGTQTRCSCPPMRTVRRSCANARASGRSSARPLRPMCRWILCAALRNSMPRRAPR
jgi:anaerobic selenocysteine-containing dehydrogenase